MWSVRNVNDESVCYHMLVGKEYVIGRKNCAILLSDDPSISRRHAVLEVHYPADSIDNAMVPSVLKLTDQLSKYGTYKNDVKLEKGAEVELYDGNIIKFGQIDSSFRVLFQPLICVTSNVTDDVKRALKKVIRELGGHVIHRWHSENTHLIMPTIKMTFKAMCCMVSLGHIVTPQYFVDLKNSILKSLPLPDVTKYLPPIGEILFDSSFVSFSINPARKNLLKGKRFVFLTQSQMEDFIELVMFAGAKCIYLTDNGQEDFDDLALPNCCVIQPPTYEMKNKPLLGIFLLKIASFLRRKRKRTIPASDLGLAIASCSIKRFCNPDSKPVPPLSTLTPTSLSQNFPAIEILAAETVPSLEPDAVSGPSTKTLELPAKMPNPGFTGSDIVKEPMRSSGSKIKGFFDVQESSDSQELDAVSGPGTKTLELLAKMPNPSFTDSYIVEESMRSSASKRKCSFDVQESSDGDDIVSIPPEQLMAPPSTSGLNSRVPRPRKRIKSMQATVATDPVKSVDIFTNESPIAKHATVQSASARNIAEAATISTSDKVDVIKSTIFDAAIVPGKPKTTTNKGKTIESLAVKTAIVQGTSSNTAVEYSAVSEVLHAKCDLKDTTVTSASAVQIMTRSDADHHEIPAGFHGKWKGGSVPKHIRLSSQPDDTSLPQNLMKFEGVAEEMVGCTKPTFVTLEDGSVVPNYKTFKKTEHAGSDQPREIIDVHPSSSDRSAIEQWIKENEPPTSGNYVPEEFDWDKELRNLRK